MTGRILVVDDSSDARSALRVLLELWGHEVREAADGRAALEAARAVGQEQWLREHIAAELTEADERSLARIVDGTARHAVRRAAEMEAAAQMLTELGVPPVMAEASRAVHTRLTAPQAPLRQRPQRRDRRDTRGAGEAPREV